MVCGFFFVLLFDFDRPVLPDRSCLIQLLLASRSTAPGRSLSAPLHTLMEVHITYPAHAKAFLSLSSPHIPCLKHRIITIPFLSLRVLPSLTSSLHNLLVDLSLSLPPPPLSLCQPKTPYYCSSTRERSTHFRIFTVHCAHSQFVGYQSCIKSALRWSVDVMQT